MFWAIHPSSRVSYRLLHLTSSRRIPLPQPSAPNAWGTLASRYFFGKSGGVGSNGGGGDGKADDNKSGKSGNDDSDDTVQIVVPSRMPFGEASPRIPHMPAVPVVSRPLFPGLVTL